MKAKKAAGYIKRRRSAGGAPLLFCLFFGSLAMLAPLSGCLGQDPARKAGYVPGIYEGTGRGYRGPVHVRLQVSPAGIEAIAITSHEERFPGAAALEELRDLVLETGSTDLDVVSGATFSSRGILDAVENALEKARR